MAISSRGAACAALNLSIFNPAPCASPVSTLSLQLRPASNQRGVAARAELGPSRNGAGLLERPTFDLSELGLLPEAQEGGDIGRLVNKKSLHSGDNYKVLLIDDSRHTEKLVETVLPQVVPSITAYAAREFFHVSRQIGVAVVIVTVKEHAEFYAQMLVDRGLRSAIEPDSNFEA